MEHKKGGMMLVIDDREQEKIFKLAQRLKIPHTKQHLLVGDYTDTEKNNICVERKTVEDFIGSYFSNHLPNQCMQMEENFDEYFVFISGKFEDLFFNSSLPHNIRYCKRSSYNKMLIHLSKSFPKLRILQFENDNQLLEGVQELFTYEGSKRITDIIKLKPAEGSTFICLLAQIPGISIKKAEAIKNIYSNLPKLQESLRANEFKVKGIGDILVKNLKETLLE